MGHKCLQLKQRFQFGGFGLGTFLKIIAIMKYIIYYDFDDMFYNIFIYYIFLLQVSIQDINDNPPRINRADLDVDLEIFENQSNDSLLIFSANDDDFQQPAKLDFDFAGENLDVNYPFDLVEIDDKSVSLSVDGAKLGMELKIFLKNS